MRNRIPFVLIALFAWAVTASAQIPHLEKRGAATQLIVDGKPWLALAGETDNTASSDLGYMETAWPKIVKVNLNTVLVGIGWDWVEPVEGKYDFSLVDGLLDGARKHNLRLIFLWFGSWKNGLSSFTPEWVKADQARFPRALLQNGKSVEVLTTLSQANLDADTRAYAAFMRHLKEADTGRRTVLMIQLENEVGLIGDSRDRSAAAEAAFARPVPPELMDYLQKNKLTLWPDLLKLWEAAGAKTAGTWQEVFGKSTAADEIFMAWNYARYMDHMARAGKAEYALPVFTNTWLVQPQDQAPGDYPSGCPEPLVIDVWKAGAPAIDINAPDVHLRNFNDWAARFYRPNNPLFVPESYGDLGGAANAFYGIGQYAGIGYSPFGVNNPEHWAEMRQGTNTPVSNAIEDIPLAKAYAVLAEMTPLITDAQAKGTIGAAWLTTQQPRRDIALGNYIVNIDIQRNRRNPVPALGYAIVVSVGPDEYFVAGRDVQVLFTPNTPGPEIAGLARVETGKFVDGKWIPGRKVNGDDVVLNYDQAAAAAQNQSGSGLIFGGDGPAIQHVKLYRYR
ncbi:MAG: DUF5597 domain-containing protein [Bryobacteraceae bacterium]